MVTCEELISSFLKPDLVYTKGSLKVTLEHFEKIKGLDYIIEKERGGEIQEREGRVSIGGCDICDIGIGGDAKHLFSNSNNSQKKNLTHITARTNQRRQKR